MSFVLEILTNPHVPAENRQAALRRTHESPGVPTSAGSTKPFWLREPHVTVSRAHSETLPEKVDIAIIGSGITGLSAAWTILQTAKERNIAPPSVAILEARDACSGATGRNGGHLLETALEYLDMKQAFGIESAKKITKFRLAHLEEIDRLLSSKPEIRRHSQFRRVKYTSIYLSEQAFSNAVEALREFQKDFPDEATGYASHTGESLGKEFGLSQHACGVITGPAGAVWPYRLVTSLLEELQQEFSSSFSIETNTPVQEIQISSSGYTITTARGNITARQIIHCTNGHVGHLVPGFRGRVFPLRGQMSTQGPGQRFQNQAHERSWLFNYAAGFDYLSQLPPSSDGTSSDGEMMLGGGLAAASASGVDEIGITDDGGMSLHADIHLSGALSAVFGHENWGSSAGVISMWTGIMGFSSDGFPWVGKLPPSLTGRPAEKERAAAEWAAVGYSGEGMVNAWLSGKAVAMMVLIQEAILPISEMETIQGWLPEQYRITEARVERAVLPSSL